MLTEIKLYLLTRHLHAIYTDLSKVKRELQALLHVEGMHPEYWDLWFARYHELSISRSIQVMMMREVGFSYRKIQSILKIAPTTIQKITQEFDLDYGEMEGTNIIRPKLEALETRLRKAGTEIW